MKNLFTLFAILLSLGLANAQTKEETVKWLTEKMMSPNFFQYHEEHPSDNNKTVINSLTFDDNILTVVGIYNSKGRDREGNWTNEFSFEYIIDLSQLDDNDVFNYQFGFRSKKQSIRMKLNQKSWQEGYRPRENNYDELNNYTSITINSSFDVDIVERFTKALQHYKSLMTVKKSTETF